MSHHLAHFVRLEMKSCPSFSHEYVMSTKGLPSTSATHLHQQEGTVYNTRGFIMGGYSDGVKFPLKLGGNRTTLTESPGKLVYSLA